jgi:hypothetical protein
MNGTLNALAEPNRLRIVEMLKKGPASVYELRPEPFEQLETWVSSFRQVWEGRLDSLDEYVQQMKRNQKHKRS